MPTFDIGGPDFCITFATRLLGRKAHKARNDVDLSPPRGVNFAEGKYEKICKIARSVNNIDVELYIRNGSVSLEQQRLQHFLLFFFFFFNRQGFDCKQFLIEVKLRNVEGAHRYLCMYHSYRMLHISLVSVPSLHVSRRALHILFSLSEIFHRTFSMMSNPR